jgi:hypothetical protein
MFAVLIAAGIVAIGVYRHEPGTAGRRATGGSGRGAAAIGAAAATARSQAAGWMARRVSRSAIVACDPAMCDALQDDGLPAANLLMLSSTTADPLGADVVVATPAVRSQFGSRLASVYAPVVMARFGAGAARIDIRVVAAAGAAAYLTQLRQDELARKQVAAQLLGNSRIRLSAAARTELTAGRVDERLLLVLPALAHVHPVSVLAFGDAGPGADPGMPLCSAELAGSYHPAKMSQDSYVRWLQDYLAGQHPPYNSQTSASRQQGETVVDVQFAMPSPLGLLKGG